MSVGRWSDEVVGLMFQCNRASTSISHSTFEEPPVFMQAQEELSVYCQFLELCGT